MDANIQIVKKDSWCLIINNGTPAASFYIEDYYEAGELPFEVASCIAALLTGEREQEA